ncbi:HEPN domain-containing protein [candidate division KSB1 bacterium]|nr:HEPN domain-containing protein [candidate division KSB1 bacterium]
MLDKTTIDLSKYRIEKAKDLLSQSELLTANKKYDGSVNRSYYAIFSAIRSLLALLKLDRSTHAGVLSIFDRYFIKTGIVDKEYSKIAHSAFDSRQDSDYEDFYTPSENDAASQLEKAKAFVNEMSMKRKKFVTEELALPAIQK